MELKSEKTVEVRFSEVDALRIVWHGNYVKYFEDGREHFGKTHGIGYLDILSYGYYAPLTDIEISFKKVLKYGDTIRIETKYIDTQAAKLKFEYQIFNVETGELVCKGTSTQVFTDKNFNLILVPPEFYKNWRIKFIKNEKLLHHTCRSL